MESRPTVSFYLRDERPYLHVGTPYWISVRMLSGESQVEYYDVNHQEMDYPENWFAHWGTDEHGNVRWIHHGGGDKDKDMLFRVYVCGD